jgi:anti-anti-sigma factor
MELHEEHTRGVVILAVKGRIDSTTAAALERTLLDRATAQQKRWVLDLSQTDYVSSAGLRVLLALKKRLDEASGRLILHGLNARVREVFDISGFAALFRIGGDGAQALALASD